MSNIKIKADSALDLSNSLEAGPAGKYGRAIINKQGALAFEKRPSKAVRLQGFSGFFSIIRRFNNSDPKVSKKLIVEYAKLTRRQGYNAIRPHVSDRYLMEGAQKDCEFNKVKLDNMDRLISEMKKNGVYTFLTIAAYCVGHKNVGKAFRGRNDMKLRMLLGDEKYRKYWKITAEKMLNHVNPYTGIAWKNDPAIVCVEFYNEQSMGLFHINRISSKTRNLLNQRWQEWLQSKYKNTTALAKAWSEPSLAKYKNFSHLKVSGTELYGANSNHYDFCSFKKELVLKQISWYEDVVRKTGYKGLITQYNILRSMFGAVARWEKSQIICSNGYFCHPSKQTKPGSRCGQMSSISTLARYWRSICASRFANRPLFVSEFNHSFWNKYQHEGGLVFSAYSAFQGFSALFIHQDAVDWEMKRHNIDFSVARSPISRANEFISSCLFTRGDVKQAQKRVDIQITNKFLENRKNLSSAINTEQSKIALLTGFAVTFPQLPIPLQVAKTTKANIDLFPNKGAIIKKSDWFVEIVDSKDKSFSLSDFINKLKVNGILAANNISDSTKGLFQNETGQITMRSKENFIKVHTDKTEGVSLEANKSEKIGALTVERSSVNACITACSIDGRKISLSSRIVFIYSTEIANSGMVFSGDRVTLYKTGSLPLLMRCGKLRAKLKNINAAKMSLYALSINGSRKEKLPLIIKDGILNIKIDTSKLKHGPTVFFEIVKE